MNINEITPKYHKKDKTYNIRGYVDYAHGVLNGEIVACEYVRLACQRFVDWFDRDDIYFDLNAVDKIINLIYKLKHTAGRFNNKPFKLLPWQQFIICNLFGWKHNDTNLRVTRNVFVMVSRKNGKTCLATAICIAALLADGNHESEIDFVANSRAQSHIAFDMASNQCKSIDPNQKIFKRFRSEIRVPALESKIQVLASDSISLDGYNASICVLDEFHSQKDWSLYNVMKSSQGSREQPIFLTITTAGFLIGELYPCYSMWKNSIDILRNEKQDDTTFSMIFQLDPDDLWDDEAVWEKCCPSIDKTVYKQYMRDEIHAAKNNRSLEVGVKTKNLNMWMQSEEVWLPDTLISSSQQQLDIDDLIEMGAKELTCGVDLSAVSDLTAASLCAKIDNKYYFKNFAFLPEDCLIEGSNKEMYKQFKRNKYLNITQGNVVDYDYLVSLLKDIDNRLMIYKVFYDSWNATYFSIKMQENGFDMIPFSQSPGNFSKYVKEFERQLRMNNIVIDKNPITNWCFANSTLKFDINNNCKPIKSDNKYSKIDIVIAMIQAFAAQLDINNYFNFEVVE